MLSHPVVNPHRPQPTQQLTLWSGIVPDWKASLFHQRCQICGVAWWSKLTPAMRTIPYPPRWSLPKMPSFGQHNVRHFQQTAQQSHLHCQFCFVLFFSQMLFLSAIHFRLRNNNHAISQEIGLSKSGCKEVWSNGDLSRQTLQPCSLFH